VRKANVLLMVCVLVAAISFPCVIHADTIYGCAHKQNGKFRIVSAPGQCHDSEYLLSWESGDLIQQSLNELLGRVQAIENALGVINEAPSMDAGEDQTILVWMTADLDGTAVDDGLVAELKFLWESVDGPGNVSFSDATSLFTSVSFEVPGFYSLRLTVFDGFVYVSDELSVLVYPDNDPPVIVLPDSQIVGATRMYRGGYHEIVCENITLDVDVSDDDLPLPLSYEWVVTEPPDGTSNYSAYAAFDSWPSDSVDWPLWMGAKTRQPFYSIAALPVYVAARLHLSVSDGYWTAGDSFEVVCSLAANDPPVVEAGEDQDIDGSFVNGNPTYGYECGGTLSGVATDDGLPSALGVGWEVLTLSPEYSPYWTAYFNFNSPNSAATDFSFVVRPTLPSYYQSLPNYFVATLQLQAGDSYYSTSDQVTVRCAKPTG
jgi:hypothetical protein